jgi:hypothetical protein
MGEILTIEDGWSYRVLTTTAALMVYDLAAA